MPKHVIAIAALSALMACAATASPQASPAVETDAANISCEVRLTPLRRGLRIEAMVRSVDAVTGEYSLVISKHGPSGTSDVSQGGSFEAPENAELALSAAEFGVARGDHYRARLVLRDESGVLCRDERRS